MTDENEPRCDNCGQPADDLIHCLDCKLSLCRRCARTPCAMLEEAPAPDLRGLAERDQPVAPTQPAGAVTDLRQTLDAQLAILGELFEQAVKPGVSMRRKTQAVDQFRIALRFVRMLAAER